MTEFEGNAIAYIFEHVDKVGANLVAQTYHNLAMHYAPVFFTLTAVYFGFCFIKMQRGHYDANDLVMLVLRSVIILTLALQYDYFFLFLYDVFTIEPLTLCKAITLHGNNVDAVSITHALDNFLKNGREAASTIFNMGSWTNFIYIIFGSFVWLMVTFTTAIAAGLIVLAKCASTVLLALSPLFIFFALFDATKGLFESYIQQLITYALVPVMTCAVLMILLSVSDAAIQSMQHHTNVNFVSLFPLSLISIIELYLLFQVKATCASLAGGFCLPSVVTTFRQTQQALSGAAKAASSLINKTKWLAQKLLPRKSET